MPNEALIGAWQRVLGPTQTGNACLALACGDGANRSLCNNLRMDADTETAAIEPDDQYVELAVEIFRMLADATRVRLVLALRDDELSVNHLAEIVDKSPAAVSQHLAKLRLAGFVTTRQEGTRVFYRLQHDHAHRLVIDAIHQAEHSLGGTPRHHLATGETRP